MNERENHPTQHFSLVIFGASGDLTQRKLVPALYNLHLKGRLPENLTLTGLSRTAYKDEEFRQHLHQGVEKFNPGSVDEQAWEDFAARINYIPGDLIQEQDLGNLDRYLKERENGSANRLYYLAVAPQFYEPAVENLGKTGMAKSGAGIRRIVVEKPFGRDLVSALKLNASLHLVFDESQIYRIDHFLGKETAQNILYFRFANTIFEPVWNRNYIDNVQITAMETVDVGRRGEYYDQAGVWRDMFQNHLMQLLALVAMEPPASFKADAIRNEKVKLLGAIQPVELSDTVAAQYEGYRQAKGVAPDSRTPTYAAAKLYIANWRWDGVPFYIQSGKALDTKQTQIAIQFKAPPHLMFPLPPGSQLTANVLAMCIQPDEGIHLRFEAKVPDTEDAMRSVLMDFHYADSFGGSAIPDAYQRLLLDAIQGDQALFTRADGIDTTWRLVDPIISGWQSADAAELEMYAPGSARPACADELLERDGRHWLPACVSHE